MKIKNNANIKMISMKKTKAYQTETKMKLNIKFKPKVVELKQVPI